MSAVLPSSGRPRRALAVAVMLWSSRSSPRSIASNTSSADMILVVLAMDSSSWQFLSYSIVPVSASTSRAALARMSGSSSAEAGTVSKPHRVSADKKTAIKRRIFM